jgi:hypothetical protein
MWGVRGTRKDFSLSRGNMKWEDGKCSDITSSNPNQSNVMLVEQGLKENHLQELNDENLHCYC